MGYTARTEAQRAAARRNGARSTGPRTAEGRARSSLNRAVHGLNSVRLLLPTEDVGEYRQHVDEWIASLAPGTAAERQLILLVADLAWTTRDDEARQFERHRGLLEPSISRQLDLLAKVRGMVKPAAASGSYERPPPVELRVVSVERRVLAVPAETLGGGGEPPRPASGRTTPTRLR